MELPNIMDSKVRFISVNCSSSSWFWLKCKILQAKSNDHLWSRKARQKLLLCIMDEWSKISTKKTTVKTLMTALSQPGFLDVKLRVEKLLLKNCPAAWDVPSANEENPSKLCKNAKSGKSRDLLQQVLIDLCSFSWNIILSSIHWYYIVEYDSET